MLKSRLTNLAKCGLEPFVFAGMRFPKHVWTLPHGPLAKRLADRKNSCTGDYYHAPKPIERGERSIGYYLDSDGMPSLRWQWCDEVKEARIDHQGWFTNEFQDETIRGVVFCLPRGRGFLAGWALGSDMYAMLECSAYADEIDTARAADSMAESAAEREREYQEQEDERQREEDAERERKECEEVELENEILRVMQL